MPFKTFQSCLCACIPLHIWTSKRWNICTLSPTSSFHLVGLRSHEVWQLMLPHGFPMQVVGTWEGPFVLIESAVCLLYYALRNMHNKKHLVRIIKHSKLLMTNKYLQTNTWLDKSKATYSWCLPWVIRSPCRFYLDSFFSKIYTYFPQLNWCLFWWVGLLKCPICLLTLKI